MQTQSADTYWDSNRLAILQEAMQGYHATVDAPGCDLYRELMTIYPRAKVVLNIRDSPEAWWYSFQNTLGPQFTWIYRILTFSIPFLREQCSLIWTITKKWRIEGGGFGPGKYKQHGEDVRKYVPRERLLEFNVKEGWEPLCKFLEVPIPDQPFPHL